MLGNNQIVCNTRCLGSSLSGVQRYTSEILERLGNQAFRVCPGRVAKGIKGHAWEQMILPQKLGGRMLWSPANTGPMFYDRQVLSLHDISPIEHPEWTTFQFREWYKFLLPKLVKRVSAIITMSEYSRSRITAMWPQVADKVYVTHLAADPRFRPLANELTDQMLKRIGLPAGRFILSVCSLEPRKNLKTLIRVWKRIRSNLPDDVRLVLAGGKGESGIFQEFLEEPLPSDVIVTGYVPDEVLPALYSRALLFVYISLYEGFGLPPLEAMSCGAPVLVSNRASLPEVIGDAGILVDPFDEFGIGEWITRFATDPSLGQAYVPLGLKRSTVFNWSKTACQTLDILNRHL